MKGIKELSEDILVAWAKGANITIPDKDIRLHWMPVLADLAKMVQNDAITVDDVYHYTMAICADPWKREQPHLWSLFSIRQHILAWVQVSSRTKSFAPPPGFKSHIDHLGRSHIWNWDTGHEIVSTAVPPVEPVQTTTHSPTYVPLGPNERIVKRRNREGFQRDYFLMGNSGLTDEEMDTLEEIAEDE